MLGMSASAWSATVYKWVDESGVTHFSDQPNPKAEKLEISGAQTYGSKAAQVAAPRSTASASASTATNAPTCAIDTPTGGQVYLDTFSITGHVSMAGVGGEDQATLRMDGQDVSALLSSDGSFTLSEVERGEHSLTLQVTNARGQVTCQATAVSFSIRQRTSAAPGIPTAPGAPTAPMAPGVGRRPNS